MNITHAKKEKVEVESLRAIFDRQKELMIKYHDIELKSGLLQTEDCPVNLDDKRGQARIKDFSWRITEEIGEAVDAITEEEGELGLLHFHEELIDGLHFLTEMTILTGYDLPSEWTLKRFIEASKYSVGVFKLEDFVTTHVKDLGMMCNCLKNKPWKQSMMKTNKTNFFFRLRLVWINYIGLLTSQGLTEEDIVEIYLKKSQVNQFRQRSNY